MRWRREGKSFGFAVLGAVALDLYGIVPTLQPAHFGRVYAALWWNLHRSVVTVGLANRSNNAGQIRPDRKSYALVGVLVIMYWPRG